jgi:hypothetical protein
MMTATAMVLATVGFGALALSMHKHHRDLPGGAAAALAQPIAPGHRMDLAGSFNCALRGAVRLVRRTRPVVRTADRRSPRRGPVADLRAETPSRRCFLQSAALPP